MWLPPEDKSSQCCKQFLSLPLTWTLNSNLSSVVWQEYNPLSLDSADFTIRVWEKTFFLISYFLFSLSSTPSLNHFTLPFSAVSSVDKIIFSVAWTTQVSLTGFFWNLTAASKRERVCQCFVLTIISNHEKLKKWNILHFTCHLKLE